MSSDDKSLSFTCLHIVTSFTRSWKAWSLGEVASYLVNPAKEPRKWRGEALEGDIS